MKEGEDMSLTKEGGIKTMTINELLKTNKKGEEKMKNKITKNAIKTNMLKSGDLSLTGVKNNSIDAISKIGLKSLDSSSKNLENYYKESNIAMEAFAKNATNSELPEKERRINIEKMREQSAENLEAIKEQNRHDESVVDKILAAIALVALGLYKLFFDKNKGNKKKK